MDKSQSLRRARNQGILSELKAVPEIRSRKWLSCGLLSGDIPGACPEGAEKLLDQIAKMIFARLRRRSCGAGNQKEAAERAAGSLPSGAEGLIGILASETDTVTALMAEAEGKQRALVDDDLPALEEAVAQEAELLRSLSSGSSAVELSRD